MQGGLDETRGGEAHQTSTPRRTCVCFRASRRDRVYRQGRCRGGAPDTGPVGVVCAGCAFAHGFAAVRHVEFAKTRSRRHATQAGKDSMKKRIVVGLAGCAMASSLTGCGGGGGSSGGASPPPPMNQTVGGIWKVDTTSNGAHVQSVGLVAENGQAVVFSHNLTNGCADVGIGSISATGSTISGTAKVGLVNFAFTPGITLGCTFSDGATSASETISGSVAQRSSLTLTGTITTSLGTVLQGSPVTATFDPLYNRATGGLPLNFSRTMESFWECSVV